LAHHRSILAFHQRVVGGPVGSRLGELDQQLVQHFRHPMVDKLAAVVAMKPEDAERELVQYRFQHRNHVLFADGFHTSDVLPLRHGVH
jgi:hypothetical protein